jgi:hypothetical protein
MLFVARGEAAEVLDPVDKRSMLLRAWLEHGADGECYHRSPAFPAGPSLTSGVHPVSPVACPV